MRRFIVAALLAGIAITQAQAQGDPARGRQLFQQCGFCHSVESGKSGMGPSLQGVFGRPVGKAPGFTYSAALQKAELSWDEQNLDRYLTNPAALLPGNMMMFPGLASGQDRQDLIAYLKSLK